MKSVEIYTDGACKGNPGPGGWGAVLISAGREKEIFGGESLTTNNRMELMAVIEALRALNQPCAVVLHLDSEYVRKGIAAKQPIKNVDLWQMLDDVVHQSGHAIDWRWVKGHSGNPGNERADQLANCGVDSVMSSM